MATTKRWQVLQAFATRLAAIATSAGYRTDAGALVMVAEKRVLGPDDPDAAIAVMPGETTVAQNPRSKLLEQLPIEIQLLVKSDINKPGWMREAGLADIKKAIEIDHDLGGLAPSNFTRGSTRPFDREQGSTDEGVGITYLVQIQEGWGAP